MKTSSDQDFPLIFTFLKSSGFQVVFTLLTFFLIVFYNAAYYIFVPVTGVWLDFDDRTLNSAIVYKLNPGGGFAAIPVSIINQGSGLATSVVLTATIDSQQTYLDATPAPTSVIGKVITWNYADLGFLP
jgi:hypothetical protein